MFTYEELGPDSKHPPVVAESRVHVGKKTGVEYRLADKPKHVVVRVVGARVTLRTKPSNIGADVDAGLKLDAADLRGLARLCAAWRAVRVGFATYAGSGKSVKFLGYFRFLYYAPRRWDAEEIKREDPRLPRFQEVAARFVVRAPTAPTSTLLVRRRVKVVHDLVSGNGELVGCVVRGPGGCCAVLTRGMLLVSAQWPAKASAFGGVAQLLVRHTHRTDDDTDLDHLEAGAILLNPVTAAVIETAGTVSGSAGPATRGPRR